MLLNVSAVCTPDAKESYSNMPATAAAIAHDLPASFAALEAALRHSRPHIDLVCSSGFVAVLCHELQLAGAFSSSRGWELPLLSLVMTMQKQAAVAAVHLAHPLQQQQQQLAGPFPVDKYLKRLMAGCVALDCAWGLALADAGCATPPPFDSSWSGATKQQWWAARAVVDVRALAHIGKILEAVAAGQVPYTAELPAAVQGICWLTMNCIHSYLQYIMSPEELQLQAAGPGLAAAAAADGDDAPDWCALPHLTTATADEQPVLQKLVAQCQELSDGLQAAATVMESCGCQQQPALLLSLQQLGQQLQQFGAAVCAALPVRFCCNNVQCLSLGGFSEQQQVVGKKNICSGCKVAR
jgi:hypothetical protein